MIRIAYMMRGAKTLHELAPGTYIIGRSPDCHIRVDSPSVSSRHLRLVVSPDGSAIYEDMNSSNGTRLNGQRVNRGSLASGDALSLGHMQIHFDLPGLAAAAPPEGYPADPMPGGYSADAMPGADAAAAAIDIEPPPDSSAPTPVGGLPPVSPDDAVWIESDIGGDSGPRAIMVLPRPSDDAIPADGSAPSWSAYDRQDIPGDAYGAPPPQKAFRLRKSTWAIGGPVLALAILYLLWPPGAKTNTTPSNVIPNQTPWHYSEQIDKGVLLYQHGDFSGAADLWEATRDEAHKRGQNNQAASVFADMARALRVYAESGNPNDISFASIIDRLDRVRRTESHFAGFVAMVMGQLSNESDMARIFQQARGDFDAGRLDEAERKLLDNPALANAILASAAADLRFRIRESRLGIYEAAYEAARRAENWQAMAEALAPLMEAYPDREEYVRELALANDGMAKTSRETEFREQGRASSPQTESDHAAVIARLERALALYDTFDPEYIGERGLADVKADYERRIFISSAVLQFYRWDDDGRAFAEILSDGEGWGRDGELARFRSAYARYREFWDAYEQNARAGDIEEAQRHLREIRDLPVFPAGHDVQTRVNRLLMNQERVASEMLIEATARIDRADYEQARRRVHRVQRLLRYDDPTDLTARLRDNRRRLNGQERILAELRRRSQANAARIEEAEANLASIAEVLEADEEMEADMRRFLDTRERLLRLGREFLADGRRNMSKDSFLKARDCAAWPVQDREVAELADRVDREYRRLFNAPLPRAAAVQDGEGAHGANAFSEPGDDADD